MWVFVNGLKVFQNYTLLQWAWFFMFYCIFGWCFESTYCSLKSMRLMTRGFDTAAAVEQAARELKRVVYGCVDE